MPRASRTSRSSFDLFKGGIHPARGIQRTIWPPCLGWRPGGLAQAAANQQTNPEPNQHGRDGVAANQAGTSPVIRSIPVACRYPPAPFTVSATALGRGAVVGEAEAKVAQPMSSREVVRSV